MTQFSQLGLNARLTGNVAEKGYQTATPIQAQAIPAVLTGKDLMAAAQTGTGKTAAFTLPMLHRLAGGPRPAPRSVRGLILTPTRELAAQVAQNVTDYSKGLKLRSLMVCGGVNIRPQIRHLSRGVDLLIATPGRLIDLLQQDALTLGDVEVWVLDEADRMLDMGFIPAIRRIHASLPGQQQTLMFSATFSAEIRALTGEFLTDPQKVEVAPANTTVEKIRQRVYAADKARKPELLKHLISEEQWGQVLVFTRTKYGADKLARQLQKSGIGSDAIHGDKSQGARNRALSGFKRGNVQVLVATDIAARGIDIAALPRVVNFDLPHVAEDYVHRIGRTGRAGAGGIALSLVSADEVSQLQKIERLIKRNIERIEVEGFEPEHRLPTKAVATKGKRPPQSRGKRKPNNGGNGNNPGRANGQRQRQNNPGGNKRRRASAGQS